MDTLSRRHRHKSSLKRAILDAALQIIDQEGYQAITIRKIAGMIEYSAPTIYEYFENKEALLRELKKEWIKKMLELIQNIHATEQNPITALQSMATAYTHYALSNRSHYRAVMGIEELNGDFAEIYTLRTILKEWIREATKSDHHLDDKVDIFRGYLHGMVSLELMKIVQGGESRCTELVNEGVDMLIFAWINKKQG